MARQIPQEGFSLGWIVSYPLMAVFAAMIFLAADEVSHPAVRPPPGANRGEVLDWGTHFSARVEALHEAVLAAPLQATVAREDKQGSGTVRWTHRLLELTIDRDRRSEVELTLESLRSVDAGVSLVSETTFNGTQVLVGLDGLLTHTMRVYWSDEPTRPRVGLVITALGDDLRLARRVLELDAQVSIAVRPFRPFSAQVAELAKMFEREVYLDWRVEDGERHGVEAALGTVPGAVGVALRQSECDDALLAALRERGLLLIATDTSGGIGPRVMLIPHDGDLDPAINAIIRQARSGGSAIGVAVAVDHDELRRMRTMLTMWSEEEIDVVKVSQLFETRTPPAT